MFSGKFSNEKWKMKIWKEINIVVVTVNYLNKINKNKKSDLIAYLLGTIVQ